MEYKVVNNDWDYDFGHKTLEECTLFESDDLDECKEYAEKHGLPKDSVVTSSGRIAEGDWYGAYDNDLGWEYD